VGRFIYGTDAEVYEIEDRTLAHLKTAILAKLRLNQTFTLTLGPEHGAGERQALWLTPSIPLRFVSDSVDRFTLNRAWVEQLVMSANTGGGMVLVAEPHPDTESPLSATA
jgi:hypothetical protein